MAKTDSNAVNKLDRPRGVKAAKGGDTDTCGTCGGRGVVARDGALETEILQADGSWEKDVVPADLVPCPDCGSGYYSEPKQAKKAAKKTTKAAKKR